MNNKIEDWLVNYFSRTQELGNDPLTTDIFDAGWIDSFGIIVLIEEIESEYNFKFGQEHLTDRRFRTINGITELVNEILP